MKSLSVAPGSSTSRQKIQCWPCANKTPLSHHFATLALSLRTAQAADQAVPKYIALPINSIGLTLETGYGNSLESRYTSSGLTSSTNTSLYASSTSDHASTTTNNHVDNDLYDNQDFAPVSGVWLWAGLCWTTLPALLSTQVLVNFQPTKNQQSALRFALVHHLLQ